MSHEKERAEFEAWYASAIWGNEDYKQSLFRAWREGREDLIRKLATVSVEPCADVILVGHEKLIHMEDAALNTVEIGAKLYTAEALAAARVQALEEAAMICDKVNDSAARSAALRIRALIGD